MSIKNRESYDSPLCKVLEVKSQSVICLSGSNEDYKNTNDPDWFGEL